MENEPRKMYIARTTKKSNGVKGKKNSLILNNRKRSQEKVDINF